MIIKYQHMAGWYGTGAQHFDSSRREGSFPKMGVYTGN